MLLHSKVILHISILHIKIFSNSKTAPSANAVKVPFGLSDIKRALKSALSIAPARRRRGGTFFGGKQQCIYTLPQEEKILFN